MAGETSFLPLSLRLSTLARAGPRHMAVSIAADRDCRKSANEPRQPKSLTLDPRGFEGKARQAYQIVRAKPSLLVRAASRFVLAIDAEAVEGAFGRRGAPLLLLAVLMNDLEISGII